MTKLIAIFIIIVALFGAWRLFLYWDQVKNDEETARKQAAATVITSGEQLPGLPQQLEPTLQAAQTKGASGLRNWLKTYNANVKDPRKAWIELDYCVSVAREDPAEARRVFALVKGRLSPSSPVWPRVKQLEKTYE